MSRKSKLSKSECRQSVQDYFQKAKRYKSITESFNQLKANFYSNMEDYFQANEIGEEGIEVESGGLVDEYLLVKRVQSSSVKFDAEKLEKKLPKEICGDVIIKKHEVTDMQGLISYLKECGVDPKVFKSFIATTKSVNVKELERLEEIGKVTSEQIKGCYTVKTNEPYFKVMEGKGQGGSD